MTFSCTGTIAIVYIDVKHKAKNSDNDEQEKMLRDPRFQGKIHLGTKLSFEEAKLCYICSLKSKYVESGPLLKLRDKTPYDQNQFILFEKLEQNV